MSHGARSDETLMQEVRAGGVAAFQALYQRHHRAVFNFLLQSLGDRQSAEDLLQEAFLRVFLHREEYRPTATFRTWLFTIVRNLVIDQLRKRRATPETGHEETLDTLVEPSASPLAHAEARELGERLQEAVRRLPPSQREVLILTRLAGLSYEEVAQVTVASVGAVRTTLHRALRRLRDLLGPL